MCLQSNFTLNDLVYKFARFFNFGQVKSATINFLGQNFTTPGMFFSKIVFEFEWTDRDQNFELFESRSI